MAGNREVADDGCGRALNPAGSSHREASQPLWSAVDLAMMRLALDEAHRAAVAGEVPVGAVVVMGEQLVASAHNLRETLADPTAHAELLAIRAAAARVGTWRLQGATCYATMEPCPMCAGALWLARADRLVFGVADPKAGAAGTLYNVVSDLRLNHRLRVESGLLAAECRSVVQGFFRERRAGQR